MWASRSLGCRLCSRADLCRCHPSRHSIPCTDRTVAFGNDHARRSSGGPVAQHAGAQPLREGSGPQEPAPEEETVTVYFRQEDTFLCAKPGDNILEVASKCGVDIPTGCMSGSCGTCEVEVTKYRSGVTDPRPVVVRSCVACIPPGYKLIEVDEVSDPIWGVDGMDL